MRGGVPAGWAWSSLEETCIAAGGGTPSKAEPGFWKDGTIPWVSPKDMKARFITSSEDRVTERALQRLTLIPAGSLLMVVRSGILSRTLPVAVTTLPVTVNQDMRAFTPHAGIAPDFLAWQLIGKERDVLSATSKDGTTVASIEAPALASFPLAVAPAAEQTRIVEKLEELLSDLDAGVAELKSAQAKLQHYRQSLLKAAVEGSLTRAWREAHPALEETGADLLARILRERRARWEAQQLAKFEAQGKAPPKGWQAKYVEPGNPGIDAAPALPSGWAWATVGQLLAGLTSGSRDWAPYYDRGSCVFVMAQNVRPWRPNFAFRQLVDPPANDRDRARSQIAKDDLLVTIVGANTGQSCRVPDALEHHFVCQSVALLRLVDPFTSEFLNAVLNSEGHGQRQFRAMNYGAGRPHLSFEQIESVLVPLPPLAEQEEILSCVTEKLAAIDEQEMQLERLHQLATAQRQNLLRAAFAGQLVPQDPADEPASALLARIRAERAAQGPARRPRASPAHGAKSLNSVERSYVGAVE